MVRSKRLYPLSSTPSQQSGYCERVAPRAGETLVQNDPIRILRLSQVLKITGLGKTTLYELQSRGFFPLRVKITDYSVGWVEQDVQAWLAQRVALSGQVKGV